MEPYCLGVVNQQKLEYEIILISMLNSCMFDPKVTPHLGIQK